VTKLWALATMVVLVAAACARPAAPSGAGAWRTYRNEQAGFMISYPASWVVREGPVRKESPVVTFLEPGGTGTVTVTLTARAPLQAHGLPTGKGSYAVVSSSQAAAEVYDRMVASFRRLP
jgi:hypothetical protein